jgi:Pyroglutamyl peptidase
MFKISNCRVIDARRPRYSALNAGYGETKSGLDLASVKSVPLRILATGFGGFPGVRANPTAMLIHALGGYRARLTRLGIDLELATLPVRYAGVARKLEELDETLKPDAILHFGLAARRKFFSIETRALNRLSLLHCDASGAHAGRLAIIPGAAYAARATFPYRQIESAFRNGASAAACRPMPEIMSTTSRFIFRSHAPTPARSASFTCPGFDAPTGRRRTRGAGVRVSATYSAPPLSRSLLPRERSVKIS